MTWGGAKKGGIEWLLSGTRHRSDGQDLDFPEFGGTAHHLDYDRYDNLFAKLSEGGFTLEGAWVKRTKGVPTAAYSTLFDDPHAQTLDANSYLDLSFDRPVSGRWELSGHASYGHSVYDGIYPYIYAPDEPVTLNKDETRASWWQTEARLLGRFANHTVVTGAEYQDNYQLNQANFDENPYTRYLDDRRSDTRSGLYLQDEMTITSTLRLNAGVRYDHYSSCGTSLNPRLALIWSPRSTTTVKWLYGTAFRAPNAYELYYAVDPEKANPDLGPEKITSYEIVLEHYLHSDFRLTAAAFANHIEHLIDQVVDPGDGLLVFENLGAADSKGIEFEAERLWKNGTRLRASYTWQWTRDASTGNELMDSPQQLGKVNTSVPLANSGWRGGLEVQYTGKRTTLAGDTADDYLLTNLTCVNKRLVKDLSVSVSVYNLFDRNYADPGGPELIHDSGVDLDTVAADGRSYRLKLDYLF